jgi:signal transduction histidine kinase
VRGDANLLAAVLANLLDNSIQYGARHCWVHCGSAPDRSQTLSVTDDGPGLPEARRRVLQEGLDRGGDGDAGGLGLKLAALVARAHRGRLVIEAGRPGGTGLSVTIVLWSERPAAGAPPVPRGGGLVSAQAH